MKVREKPAVDTSVPTSLLRTEEAFTFRYYVRRGIFGTLPYPLLITSAYVQVPVLAGSEQKGKQSSLG